MGKVPLLVTDDNLLVPESSNYHQYLDQFEQSRRLIPADPDQARNVRLWDRLANQYLCSPSDGYAV